MRVAQGPCWTRASDLTHYLCLYVSICVCLHFFLTYLSIYLSTYLPTYLSIYLSLSISLSLSMYSYISVLVPYLFYYSYKHPWAHLSAYTYVSGAGIYWTVVARLFWWFSVDAMPFGSGKSLARQFSRKGGQSYAGTCDDDSNWLSLLRCVFHHPPYTPSGDQSHIMCANPLQPCFHGCVLCVCKWTNYT